MSRLRSYLYFILLSISFLLVSCFDGKEEVWIYGDGSGRAEITYTLPASVAKLQGGEENIRKLIESFFQNDSKVTLTHCEVSSAEGRLKVHVQASFKNALDLKKMAGSGSESKLPAAAKHFIGKVNADIKGWNIDFTRTTSPGLAIPGVSWIPVSQFEGHKLSYIIHLPTVASQSNADRVENAGRTLIWEYPLSSSLKEPLRTHFVAPLPIPKWVITTMIATALLLGIFIFAFIKWFRKKRVA